MIGQKYQFNSYKMLKKLPLPSKNRFVARYFINPFFFRLIMNSIVKILRLALLVVLFQGCSDSPKIRLGLIPLFSDNMVLQQQKEIPVWGVAPPNATVVVSFRNQVVKTKVNDKGKWIARLNPERVGKNETLIVKCKGEKRTYKNVAVGEVWIASGQSNMEVPLVNNWGSIKNGAQEASAAHYPDIRLFTVGRNVAVRQVDTLVSEGWRPCTPETARDFSATAFFFGRELYNEIHLPIGLIQTAWGGTVAEAWTSAESLELMEDFTSTIQKLQNFPATIEGQQKQFEKDNFDLQIEMSRKDPGILGNDTLFVKRGLNESDWGTMNLPGFWENSTFGIFDGSVWFRKHIEIPLEFTLKEMTLHLGPSDDFDEAWVNGRKVGQSDQWDVPRRYAIPANVIRSGDNIITLRVTDFQGSGGFSGDPDDFYLSGPNNFRVDLSGQWLVHAGYNKRNIETIAIKPDDQNLPSVLFNAMINPLIPYAFRGVIWYQGESNTGRAWQYRDLFSTLITDWRTQWNNGNFPFYFVQLANFMQRNDQPVDDMWAELREAQALALQLPNTGMAVAIDIGEADDIHPANKQDVGKRLALWALKNEYGKSIPCSGPLYKDYMVDENSILIFFDHTYNGLAKAGGRSLTGFTIAGEDKKFVWAEAEIIKNSVMVYSKEVLNPVAVRYGWSSNPDCNLINSANLPAGPFRTDEWELITK
jgi:sialate O-acetylesterase